MAYTTINKPSLYFNTLLWTGDNTNRTLTGVGFQPDFVWWKQRNGTDDNRLIDSVRGEGTTSYKVLFSNTTDVEYNGNDNGGSQGNINALNSDGFSGAQGTTGWNNWNGSTYNYVAWNWLASNTTVSNTSGSISSTVSVNTTAGFSVVSYTGTATAGATVGHGLGVAPSMIITKARTIADNWGVYHKSLGATKALYLNTTNAEITSSAYYNNTAPSSTVVTLGDNEATNDNAGMIMYAFAEIKGYSKFGSWTGNGSTNGTFVYTGFKPAWVMIKRSDTGINSWHIVDNKRNTYNGMTLYLNPNSSGAEQTYSTIMDFTSNGFKLRDGDPTFNPSGGTMVYMAFAENPFVSATAIPTTAR